MKINNQGFVSGIIFFITYLIIVFITLAVRADITCFIANVYSVSWVIGLCIYIENKY